jgi:hypothetical protein
MQQASRNSAATRGRHGAARSWAVRHGSAAPMRCARGGISRCCWCSSSPRKWAGLGRRVRREPFEVACMRASMARAAQSTGAAYFSRSWTTEPQADGAQALASVSRWTDGRWCGGAAPCRADLRVYGLPGDLRPRLPSSWTYGGAISQSRWRCEKLGGTPWQCCAFAVRSRQHPPQQLVQHLPAQMARPWP